jgi:hypothetical protein
MIIRANTFFGFYVKSVNKNVECEMLDVECILSGVEVELLDVIKSWYLGYETLEIQ